jgi:hypothetical protein
MAAGVDLRIATAKVSPNVRTLVPGARERSAMAFRRFIRRPAPGPAGDLAPARPKEAEQEERRLGTAILNGDIPPIWYRQRMAALAAGEPDTAEVGDAPPTRPSD